MATDFDKFTVLPDLLARLRWVIEWDRPKEWRLRRSLLPYSVFWLFLSGEKQIEINGAYYRTQPGSLIVIPPEIPFHVPALPEDSELHYYTLVADFKIGIHDLTSQFGFPLYSNLDLAAGGTLLENWREMVSICEQIEAELDSRDSFPLTLLQLDLQARLHSWMSELCRLQQRVLSQRMPEQEPRVHRICSEIAMSPAHSYSLADLAEMAGISESHLRHLFHKHLGVSPMEYVRKARLRKARELLLGTGMQIQEISDMLGYLNPPTFTRAFRSEEGVSPKAYRERFLRI